MIVGIDLGTTNSLAGIFRNGKVELVPNVFGDYLTPSVVGLDDDGELIVGKLAKERLVTKPDLTVSQFKRFMGSKHPIQLGERTYQAEELSSFIIRKLIEDTERYTGEKVEEIIVSVPAYFNDAQRYATKLAGQYAGVKIDRIINEPSAASLAQKMNNEMEDQSFIVVDFGGGTLDISVVESFDNIVEILAIAGDNRLGGEDYTAAIAQEFLLVNDLNKDFISNEFYYKVLVESEKAKLTLNSQDEVQLSVADQDTQYDMTLSYKRFYEISQPLLARVKAVLDRALFDANHSHVHADDFVLVGGTSKLRLVQEFLSFCIGQAVKATDDPDLMIAKGCALVAGIKERQGEVRDLLLSDICPFSLGVEVVGDKYSPIIERNSSLPSSRVERYYAQSLGQTQLRFNIYQGERMRASENLLLGSLVVDVPENYQDYEAADVRFTYDLNGILDVEVTVLSTGQVFSKIILQDSINLSEEEIAKKKAELEKYKINVQETEVYRYLIERADRLYSMILGVERENLMERTRFFEQEVAKASLPHLPKLYDEFSAYLDRLERGDRAYYER